MRETGGAKRAEKQEVEQTTTQTAVKSRKLNGKKTELQAQGARGKRELGVLGGGGAPPGWVVGHGSGVETEESPGWDSKKSRSWKGLRCQAEGLRSHREEVRIRVTSEPQRPQQLWLTSDGNDFLK